MKLSVVRQVQNRIVEDCEMIADDWKFDWNLRNLFFLFCQSYCCMLLLHPTEALWCVILIHIQLEDPMVVFPSVWSLSWKNVRKRKQNGRKRHVKTYKKPWVLSVAFRCVQRHWTHFYFPWIGVMLILWGCYGMVGWPRRVAVYCVCNADVWLFQRGSTSRFSWKREIRGQCEMFAKCPGESNKMDGTFTIQHMLHFRCWFRWRPCCKTLQKLSEVPREAALNSYFEIVRKDSKGWQKEHFHLAVIFYTYILFTN